MQQRADNQPPANLMRTAPRQMPIKYFTIVVVEAPVSNWWELHSKQSRPGGRP